MSFGAPRLSPREADGRTFTMVELDGCRPGGTDDGMPGIPVFTRLLAVPQGARVVVDRIAPVVREVRTLLLYPYQAQEGDFSPAFEVPGPYPDTDEDWTPPFAYDEAAYDGTMAYPPDPVHVSDVSPARDLRLVVLRIAAGRYVPQSRELSLYDSVEFDLHFEGGTGLFLGDGAGNPFEEGNATIRSLTWNHAAIESVSGFAKPTWIVRGEELLILVTPAYLDAANRLAAHKNGRGLLTSVVLVNDGAAGGGPDTGEEIQTFLDARYDNALVRFSYLLLMGDADDIPPFVLPRRYKDGEFPSDFPYAQIHTDPMADALVPSIAVGRIPVDSLAEADTVVDKIIGYEATPPTEFPGGSFYGRAAIASYFQPHGGDQPDFVENGRRFIQDSEDIRNHMVDQGFDVQRIYTAHTPLTPDNTPRFYRDGTTPLPAPLRPEDGYPWDGDAQQIIDAFNAGKSLFFHVDHGWSGGWGDPWFSTSHLGSLVNDELLPLVLSDNCSSGAFDYVSPGFAESILRMSGGGAIGVMAFTRNSNNTVGRQFIVGVVDALWPDTYGNIGDDQPHPRLGDMLNYARGVMTRNYTSADAGTKNYKVAWCYSRMLTLFGDPTLEVWVQNPNPLPVLGRDFVAGPAIDFVYPYAGATITVFEDFADGAVPIGRGMVAADGRVHVDPIVGVVDTNDLLFFASAPGAVPTPVSVSSGP